MKKTLLLVEDEAIIALAEIRQLSNAGYSVLHASTGEEAVETVRSRETPVDLILMDINLGQGIDGTEAAAKILKTHAVPVVFLSSHTEKEIVDKTEEITSYGYVVKNSGETVLLASIKMAFKLFEAHVNLQHWSGLMEKIIRHDFGAVAVFDRNLVYKYVSSRYLQDYRIGEPNIIGKHHYDVFPEIPETWKTVHRRALGGAVIKSDGEPFPRSDGALDFIRWECRPWHESDGSIGGMLLYSEVITDRIRAEEELRLSEERFRSIVEGAPDPIFIQTRGKFAYVNPAMIRLVGASSDEDLLGRPVLDHIHPDQRAAASDRIRTLNEKRLPVVQALETGFLRLDGHTVWVETVGTPIEYQGDNGALVFARDITERKISLEALRRSEEYLSTILDSIGDAVLSTDTEGRIVRMNPVAEKLTGWKQEAAAGQPLRDVFRIVDARTRLPEIDPVRKVLETGTVVEMANHTALISRNGEEYQIADSAAPIRGVDSLIRGVVLVFRDITEQYRAREALVAGEANLREAQEIAILGRWELDIRTKSLNWSDTIYRIFEIDREKFGASYQAFLEAIHPDDRERVDSAYTESLRTKKPYRIEHRLLMSDGRVKWVIETCRTEYDDSGNPVRSMGVVQDITAWKEAGRDLEKRNAFILTVLNNIPLGIAVNDLNSGRATYLNDKFSEIYGWPKEALEDIDHFFECVYPDPDHRKELMERILADIRSGDPGRMKWDNIAITTSEGETRYVCAANIPLQEQNIMVSTVQDVTDRVRREELLHGLIDEKDVLMRELQHRVKNNLTVISSLLALEMSKIEDEEPRRVFMDAQGKIQSMVSIYDRVYNSDNLSRIDLGTYLKDLSEELFRTYSIAETEIRLRTHFDTAETDLKKAVPAGLILNELLANALKYAYPEGGGGEIRISLRKEGTRITLRVSDDGVGLPENGESGKSRGTGLLLVKALADQIGGTLQLMSPPGTSAEISLTL